MNYSHLNRLSIVMRSLEDAVVQIDSALGAISDFPPRIMSIYTEAIPNSVKEAVRDRLVDIRHEIEDVKEYYSLTSRTISISRILSSKLLILAIDLTECRSAHLRSYGEVPNEEKGPLDDRMLRLEAKVNELRELLNQRGSEE